MQKLKKFYQMFKKKPKIEVFVRSCFFSPVSNGKKRPPYFSREICYQNLLHTIQNESRVRLTFFLDTFFEKEKDHFLQKEKNYPVIEIKEGTEGGSFVKMLDYVLQLPLAKDTLVYFLEDDYLHRPGWVEVLQEGFDLNCSDYVSLYDHRDKYFSSSYKTLTSRIYHTKSCHWRTTPSTTNTYAMRFGTLLRDEAIHRQFSKDRKVSQDHEKFIVLGLKGATLITPLPGWSTHMEPDFESPCVDWQEVLSKTVLLEQKL